MRRSTGTLRLESWKKTEGGGRVRFLSDPEEKRLRSSIDHRFPEFLPPFVLSIHTGMRMSEQYGLPLEAGGLSCAGSFI